MDSLRVMCLCVSDLVIEQGYLVKLRWQFVNFNADQR